MLLCRYLMQEGDSLVVLPGRNVTVRCHGAGLAFAGDPSLVVGANSTLLLDDCKLVTSIFLALVEPDLQAPAAFSIDGIGGLAADTGGLVAMVGSAFALPCEVRHLMQTNKKTHIHSCMLSLQCLYKCCRACFNLLQGPGVYQCQVTPYLQPEQVSVPLQGML